jgi:sugar phosphate isomerase/epimerase
MSPNLVPQPENRPAAAPRRNPVIGVRTASLIAALPSLPERLAWARANGFGGVEIAATGRPRDLYAPSLSRDERARLRGEAAGFSAIVVEAPHQETYDVTLVSPSASIRRASVTEIWACLRFAEALGGGTVVVRTGNAPAGVDADRQLAFVAECLTTLDRMAGDHNARVAVVLADYFKPVSGRADRIDLIERLSLAHTGIALDASASRDEAQNGDVAAAAAVPGLVAAVSRAGNRLAHLRLGPFDGKNETRALAGAAHEIGFTGMICLAADPDASSPLPAVCAAKSVWEGLLAHAAA